MSVGVQMKNNPDHSRKLMFQCFAMNAMPEVTLGLSSVLNGCK